MKIITVNLNPSIDKHIAVQKYVHGGLNRVRVVREDVAGKGINVAVALKNLGLEPICMGFNFSQNGLVKKLDALKISHDFIEVDGAIRENIKLFDEATQTTTELNQSGAFVSEDAQKKFLKKLLCLNEEKNILVLSGSYPQGIAADFYARICEAWRGRVFLDTEGDALRLALENAPPFLIKPNLFELESAFGVVLNSDEIADFCKKNIIAKGVQMVCVSMGADGAILVTREKIFSSPAISVSPKGVAGAGDAMIAGLIYANAKNFSQEKFLPSAIAAASASVILEGTQMCSREDFEKFLQTACAF